MIFYDQWKKKVNRKLNRVDQVVKWRLCTGCGACVPGCPQKAVSLIDVFDQGIRPKVDTTKCQGCGKCMEICPGIELSHSKCDDHTIGELRQSWGPIVEIWEGYATDPEIRFKGSSGGAATALALYCLEKKKMKGVLHIGSDLKQPLSNIPVFSQNREDLLRCTGSRYSPAAPCEKFDWISQAEGECVFIGKPCDVAALHKFQMLHPGIKTKIGLTISIFCAGSPPTKGTIKLLEELGVKPEKVKEIRYRGCGWPGMTSVTLNGDTQEKRQMTYEKSWGNILCNYVPFRCRLCPDSTGEFADISCGDPWYREIKPDELGRSLVLVRTEHGRKIVHHAMDAKYLKLGKVSPEVLPVSQKALLNKRQDLFGRLLAMRMFLIPVPLYNGFFTFRNWHNLSIFDKVISILSTVNRIIVKKWWRPLVIFPCASKCLEEDKKVYRNNNKRDE
jgi:coenzyme F420 hydrogenase subunit beta